MQLTACTNSLVRLLTFFVLVGASPAAVVDTRAMLDVYVPNITSPNAQTVWPSNSTQMVTWDASNPPTQITNPTGQVRLVSNGRILPVIMAEGFDIRHGQVDVLVPWVLPGSYSIVLFGDSGDWSPLFTITAP